VPQRFVSSFFTSISLHDFCGCNSHCVYCAGSEYELPEKYVATFDHEVLFRNLLADRMIRPSATIVSWGGGEPTLVNSFDGTVEFLSQHRIRQIINTSGIRFSLSAQEALVRRTASVQISVDSGTNETYARVKRNRRCDDVWESIRCYAATGGDMLVKYIIFSMNSDLGEVEAFVSRCQKAGVRRIVISADVRSIFDWGSGVAPIADKELSAAASMRNLAKQEGIEAAFIEGIWTPQHLDRIGELGGFDAHRKPSRLGRIRRISSLADARDLAGSAVRVVRRTL
jgi:pyruvate-formate lyase-activating enzyme